MSVRSAHDVQNMMNTLGRLQAAGLDAFPLHVWDARRTGKDGKQRKVGKVPAHIGWQDIDYSEFDFRNHFRLGGNLGLRLGRRDKVIDIDPRNGGRESYAALCADLGVERLHGPDVPCVFTGSGGLHIFARLPEDMVARVSLDQYPGIDFKGFGGLVVAAGSTHPTTGQPYRLNDWWKRNDLTIPELPSKLVEMLRRPLARERTGDGGEIANADLAVMLAVLDPTDYGSGKYSAWIALSAACYDATDGQGFEPWADWCLRDEDYADVDVAHLAAKWDSFECGRLGGSTYRSLFRAVIQAGHPELVRRIGAKLDFDDLVQGQRSAPTVDNTHRNRLAPVKEIF